jgi:DNA-binding NarL/FixJ family response regulator
VRSHGSRVRIVIADDHPIFRDGLKRLLESEPGFSVVGEAADGTGAIDVVRHTHPDILLLDVAMPRMNGIDALRAPEMASTRVVILTASIEAADLYRAVQHGARGVVLKETATRELIEGLHRVMDGKLLIGADVADQLARAVRSGGSGRSRPFGLTPREGEIVDAVAAGDSNREIAARLGISLQTVKHHLTSIFAKTGTGSRLELALFALRQGLAESE